MYYIANWGLRDITVYEYESAISSGYASYNIIVKRKIYDQVENWKPGTQLMVAGYQLVKSKEDLISAIFEGE